MVGGRPVPSRTQTEGTEPMELTATYLNELTRQIDGVEDVCAYSGRGMYGATCVGVYLDASLPATAFGILFGAAIVDHDDTMSAVDVLAEVTRDLRTDSMGLGTVVYWPHIAYVDDVENAQLAGTGDR